MSEAELNEKPREGGFPVSLPTFEGPLDLLLHLCQKHELDILDIPIGFVTEKYLEYLAVMQLLDLDVASEYLVMAATLAHIKSKSLLPAPPPGQEDDIAAEEIDPREALIKRLLEYQKYKAASEELQSRGVAGRDVFLRGSTIEDAVSPGLPPLAQVPLFSLVEAFQAVLEKSKVKLTHDIVHERITLADRINELVDVLRVKRKMTFEEFFEGATTRFDLVITFLALLEMTKLRMTRLYQADFNSQIYVEFCAQVTAEDEEQEQESQESQDGAGEVPPDDDSEKTIIDAAPPAEIDDLLAPDEDVARDLHEEAEAEAADEPSPNSALTAEFVMPAGGLDPGPESEVSGDVTREMKAPVEAIASAFGEEAGTSKSSTVAEPESEADMLLASLDGNDVVDSEPPLTDEEPSPISQDVPPLDEGDGDT